MQIRVSVVIPTYKRPLLLLRCLDAFLNQSLDHKEFEIIIISDGPDEYTEWMLNKWVHNKSLNINYLHTPEKEGPAGARNMGWREAKAELIAFTDDDCIPDQNWLKLIAESYKLSSFTAFTGKTVVPPAKVHSDFAQNTSGLETAEFITANCACAKSALILIGGFDSRFKRAWREDSDLQFRLLLDKVEIIHIDKAIVYHPVRRAAWGISIKEQKNGIYDALLYKKHPALYCNKIQRQPPWNYYITILLWLALIVSLLTHQYIFRWATASLLLIAISIFLYNRLRYTDKSINHIAEMLITSILIPFFSIYWRIYGGIKFRVFFI